MWSFIHITIIAGSLFTPLFPPLSLSTTEKKKNTFSINESKFWVIILLFNLSSLRSTLTRFQKFLPQKRSFSNVIWHQVVSLLSCYLSLEYKTRSPLNVGSSKFSYFPLWSTIICHWLFGSSQQSICGFYLLSVCLCSRIYGAANVFSLHQVLVSFTADSNNFFSSHRMPWHVRTSLKV